MSTSTSTSIGRGPAHGSNENHDGDPTHKTLGEAASPDEAPAGSDVGGQAAPEAPAGARGTKPAPGIAKGPQGSADGPDAGDSPRDADAARGHPPKDDPAAR